MKFSICTLFPEAFESYFTSSILKRAQEKKLIHIEVVNIRDFTKDKHRKADDKPYGGGPGMVMKAEPIVRTFDSIKKKSKRSVVVIFTPNGKQFSDIHARNFAKKYDHIILVAGHYEGVDERVKKILKAKEISIGPYVLTGGELPAMIMVDAVSRHIQGVLGREESLEEKRYGIGVPVYTRPEIFTYKKKNYQVPKELVSGSHKKIDEWRKKNRKDLIK